MHARVAEGVGGVPHGERGVRQLSHAVWLVVFQEAL